MQASISNRIRSFLIGSGIRFVNETRLRIKRSAAWLQKNFKTSCDRLLVSRGLLSAYDS